ncbi:RDD family protein [Streptomyces sp. RKAG290]|uniref:RDD family protein n=1 Tax=Streptomyces sp. RKAG290 TaxID=2888348 RepID=UPI0020337156|nr:RDD family protein [Streptomyces sp. RKAG290]MCM2413750.1 RDD family protein [Streptomyces sp. RKAG290]
MNELVTGDAVVLGLRPAKLPSRALALVIDLVVVGTAFVAVSIGLVMATAALDEAATAAISVATFLLVLVGAPIAVETLSHGRSLGKLACGLRVVRDDGGPIRFRHALVRGAMGVVEILMTVGVVASVASLVSARGRRLGDVFAGTLVIRERVPAGRAAAVPPPPPWLVGRFAGLDLSAVPDELWLAVRQYLTRMHQLDADVGRSMAGRLAGELAARTGVPAPAGVPAAAFLAAVVNERQVRDARRVFAAGRSAAGGPAGVGAHAGWPGPMAGTVTAPWGSGAHPAPPAHSAPSAPAAPSPHPAPAAHPARVAPVRSGGADGAAAPGVDGAQPPATGFAPPA